MDPDHTTMATRAPGDKSNVSMVEGASELGAVKNCPWPAEPNSHDAAFGRPMEKEKPHLSGNRGSYGGSVGLIGSKV